MSNGKRRFDFLGIPNLGGPGDKRTKSPSRITTGNASIPVPSTQSTESTTTSQPTPSSDRLAIAQGKAVLSVFKKSLNVLKQGCGLFAPLVEAAGVLQEALDAIEASILRTIHCGKSQEEGELRDMASNLAQWAILLAKFLEENQPIRMSKQLENLINVLGHQANCLGKQYEAKSTQLTMHEQNTARLERCHHQVEEALQQLLTEASLSIWKNTDNQLKDSLLNRMLLAHDALYDSSYADEIERGPCLENTRVSVLDRVRRWIYDLSETKVYWINGMAGTGKTTIAYSVCEELARNKRLGASFFVSRASSQCQDVSRILPTIAYQLARVSDPYRSALCHILNKELNVGQRRLSVQFEHLIELPLRKVAGEMPRGLVVVVDALDECSGPRPMGEIVDILLQHASKLPVRFFLTSRPDPLIIDTVLSKDARSRSVLHLHNVEEQLVKADIKTYLTVSLSRLQPTHNQLEWLAEQAGVLFIYAATLVRYVLSTGFGTRSKARLIAILAPSTMEASKKHQAIDELYKAILKGVLQDDMLEEHELRAIHQVLWTVVCVREPVTTQTLAELSQVDGDQVTEALGLLQSVIHISEASGIVSTLHASFPEFMLDPLRSTVFSCDIKAFNQYLATRCFVIMQEQLRFNICGLRSSYEFDKSISDIDARVQAAISSRLFYACRFWAEHLTQAAVLDAHFQYLDTFVNLWLLFWMEVLNLKDWIKNGPKVLVEAQKWLMSNKANQRRHELLDDAIEFVAAFATNPSRIRQCYLGRTRGLITVETTVTSANSGEKALVRRTNSVAFSPDGTKVATGSNDGVIYIWDSCSGSTIAGPLEAGPGPVEVVVFSPNGLSLACASSSCLNDSAMIQIWSMRSGTSILGPITAGGPDRLIPSVAFSPDGARIAFVEFHKYYSMAGYLPTLTVLDTHTGHTIFRLDPIDPTKTVAFSSDGAVILAHLFSGKIQMWGSHTGIAYDTQVDPPIIEHPDTRRLLSSPMQSIVAKRWSQYGYFMDRHVAPLMVTVFSPTEEHVTCGYHRDSGLHLSRYKFSLRDTRSDSLLAGPFGFKDEEITAFAFSPDGTRIVSGSERQATTKGYACAVRIWDIYQGPNASGQTPYLINMDGWLLDQDSRPILWVPAEWRAIFPFPPNNLVIHSKGVISMTNLLLGESWAVCYNPDE